MNTVTAEKPKSIDDLISLLEQEEWRLAGEAEEAYARMTPEDRSKARRDGWAWMFGRNFTVTIEVGPQARRFAHLFAALRETPLEIAGMKPGPMRSPTVRAWDVELKSPTPIEPDEKQRLIRILCPMPDDQPADLYD